jgi:hypothetical protein
MDRSEWFLWFDDGGFRHEFQTVGEERAILKSSRNAARSRRPASICSLMTRAAILLRRSVSSRAERMRFKLGVLFLLFQVRQCIGNAWR